MCGDGAFFVGRDGRLTLSLLGRKGAPTIYRGQVRERGAQAGGASALLPLPISTAPLRPLGNSKGLSVSRGIDRPGVGSDRPPHLALMHCIIVNLAFREKRERVLWGPASVREQAPCPHKHHLLRFPGSSSPEGSACPTAPASPPECPVPPATYPLPGGPLVCSG